MRKARGFTLIELAVVAAVVGILAVAAVPLAELNSKRAKEQELRRSLREVRVGLDAYKAAVDSGHIAKRAGGSGYPPRLEDLTAGIGDIQTPTLTKIYFLRRLPRDPTFPDATVPAAQTWGKRSYASSPEMPTEGDDIFDVYSLSDSTGINGVPYRDW
ncbi:type II secretion system protein [Dechloromonas sp. HYN0024]|uniref:type II secretion system protein n=1 Tax=Dechloromonas sp. HYN0024 TaxID=2231055 RepID=UPI001F076631|nr:type II secretion system protein [Dechloromonas sp. HYN0024]